MELDLPALHDSLSRTALRHLQDRLRGALILPGDATYDRARTVWSGNFDRQPGLIVRAADVIDVIRAVNFAREQELAVAVRSGGHSFAGFGTIDGGLLIDLSPMKGMSIDPRRRVARAEPGLTWGEYAQAAQPYGLATSSGDVATVGIGGLALGGGIGWMARKYGLTIDHLLSVELVTADGRFLTASASENADLFWGLRGGGGNFGIATSFEFQLQPVDTILGGAVFYPAAGKAREILEAYLDYASGAPDELTTMAILMKAPPAPFIPAEHQGQPVVAIMLCYSGDLSEGERVVAPLRRLARPIADVVAPMPYPGIFALTKEAATPGMGVAVRPAYLESLEGGILDLMASHGEASTSPMAFLQLRVLGGAMARVPADATAFAHRDKPYLLVAVDLWPAHEEPEPHHAELQRFWSALQPHSAGAYVNFLADDSEEGVHAAYPAATYQRLAALKRRYDPTNFFRQNQNIKPQA